MISKGNHVKFARFVLLAVSEEAKTWLPARFASLTEQVIEKIVEDKDSQKTKRSTKVAKELFADYVKKKNWENLKKRKSWHKLWKHTFYVEASRKEFVQCIIKRLLDSVFVISRITKVSVRIISLSLRLRLITSTSILIILDITKTSSNNSLILVVWLVWGLTVLWKSLL